MKSTHPDNRWNVKVDHETVVRLKALAALEERSMSAVLRRAVDDYFERGDFISTDTDTNTERT